MRWQLKAYLGCGISQGAVGYAGHAMNASIP